MPQDKRVKRARSIAVALRLARVESKLEALTQPPSANLLVLRSGGSESTPDLVATHLASTESSYSQDQRSISPVSEVPSRVRGVTRGKSATKLRRQLGHNIPVPILISSHRPEGEHALSLVNHLGLAIREVALVRAHGWKKLDSGIKLVVIAAIQGLRG